MFIKFDNAIIRTANIVSAFYKQHGAENWRLYIETKDGVLYEDGFFPNEEKADLALERLFDVMTEGTDADMSVICGNLSEAPTIGERYNIEHSLDHLRRV